MNPVTVRFYLAPGESVLRTFPNRRKAGHAIRLMAATLGVVGVILDSDQEHADA